MFLDPLDHVEEFIESEYFKELPDCIRSEAVSLLHFYFTSIKTDQIDSITSDLQEKILLGPMLSIKTDSKVLNSIPLLIKTYYHFLAQTGRNPGASVWEAEIEQLEKKFLSRIRQDGTVKGETFKKNYTDVGRNDPCPCGSGLKFKKCCMGLIDR